MPQCHEIDYQVFGDDLQYVEVELDPGETVIAEAGAMNYVEDGIEYTARMGDGSQPEQGLFGKLLDAGKRTLTGESIFMTHFTNHADDKRRAAFIEERLADLAPALTLDVIDQLEAGTAVRSPQEASLVSKAPRLHKEQGAIDWSQSSQAVACHVRAMQPWPKPFTFLHHADAAPLRVLVLDVDPVADAGSDSQPGTIVPSAEDSLLVVRTGDGAIRINQLQPAGKRAMSAEEFLRGHSLHPGDRLGNCHS